MMIRSRKYIRSLIAALIIVVCALTASLLATSVSSGAATTSTKEGIKLGFAERSMNASWYQVLISGANKATKAAGDTLLVSNANNDIPTQNSQVSTFITEGVKGVIMNPADSAGVASSVNALHNANIPLVIVNSNLDPSLQKLAYCFVSENQKMKTGTGAGVGRQLAKVAKTKWGSKATLKTLIVGGVGPSDTTGLVRAQGFMSGYKSVSGAPKLKTLPMVYAQWAPDQAYTHVRQIGNANPDLKVVYVMADNMMPGVERALKADGLWNKVIIGGYDAEMSVVKYMKQHPKGPILADGASGPSRQGALSVQLVLDALKGVPQSKVCKGGNAWPSTLIITPSNAKSYYKAGVDY